MEREHTVEEYIFKNQKKLRYGITTGSCATAAAGAAARHLFLDEQLDTVTLKTPKGIVVSVPVNLVEKTENKAEYMVIKDSGDDPDVTNGAEVHVSVEILDSETLIDERFFRADDYEVYLTGGIGIGRVTKEGLEQQVNQFAINSVPRHMIFSAVCDVLEIIDKDARILITVSMPEGEALAKRTFNPKLGIEGGLSILGTSGILEPMSERSIVDTIETEIKQLSSTGVSRLLVTPGNYGQGYASEYLGLNLDNSVKCSNYIGDTIDLAVSYGMKSFLLVGNIGKLVKLAAGIMNTHSKTADGRGEIFGVHAAMCGASTEIVRELMECINTDKMLELLEREKLKTSVLNSIINKIYEKVAYRIAGSMEFAVVLFSEKYGYLGATENSENIIDLYRK